MNLKISSKVDTDRVFLIKRGEMEGRLDPFFYKPEFVKIDKIVKSRTITKLGDLIISISSGATPRKSEQEKYYSDKKSGIPFLRVQNITEEGINLNDAKYINRATHEDYLKRSQVYQDNLLVTITGRIASSAVVPFKFIGNINQHSVVIKTKNKEVSQYIAAFLNSNIGQILALKRTTGGTRPALDYEALSDIPILENLSIVAKMDVAYATKKQKEAEAQRLIDSIDDYILGELGIELPEQQENTLQNRIFKRQFSEVSGGRFDPFYNRIYYTDLFNAFENSNFQFTMIKNKLVNIKTGTTPHQRFDPFIQDSNGIIFLRNTNLKKYEIDLTEVKRIKQNLKEYLTYSNYGDVIMCIAGTVGISAFNIHERIISINQNIAALKFDDTVDPQFITYWFNTKTFLELVRRNCSIATILYLNNDNLNNLPIPTPPLAKQTKIVNHITKIRAKAKQLQQQAKAGLEQAKKEVEAMILGKDKKGNNT